MLALRPFRSTVRVDALASARQGFATSQACQKKGRSARQEIEDDDNAEFGDEPEGDLFAVSDESAAAGQSLRQQNLQSEQRAKARQAQIDRIRKYVTLTKAEKRATALLATDKPIQTTARNSVEERDVQELKSVLKRWRFIGGVVSRDTGSLLVSRLKELHADVLAEEILANPSQYGVFANAANAGVGTSGTSPSTSTIASIRSFSTSARRPAPSSSASARSTTKTCPSCSTSLPLAASPCASCAALVPIPSDISFYQLFDLPERSFAIDVRDLRSKFLRRQQKIHPDTFKGSDERVQALAASQSSFLNKAYSTLADPLARAQYLLELHGKQIAETDSLTDPELLMDILDAREQLEEASTEEEMTLVRQSNAERTETTLDNLATAFSSASLDIDRAKILAIELQYLRNLENAAKDWAPGKRVEIQH